MNGLMFVILISITRICFWVVLSYVEPRKADQASVQRHRQVLIICALSENLVWWILHSVIGWDEGQLSKEAVLKVVESYALYRAFTVIQTRWVARPISALRRYLMVDGSIVERNGSLYRLACLQGCLLGRTIPEYIKHGNVSPSGWLQYDEMAALGWDRYIARSVKDYFEERHLAHGYRRDEIEVIASFVRTVWRNSEKDDVDYDFNI